MEQRALSGDFITELFKLCLTSTKILEICKKHLKYQYLVTESQKKVLKFINESYELSNKIPTLGVLQQTFSTDQDTITFLTRVKKIIIDSSQHDEIINTLEIYIKDSRFRILYDKIGDLYNAGKQKQAIELLAKESKEITEFKLKDNYYTTIFKNYQERQANRVNNKDSLLLEKLTFGIHELDDLTKGGFNKGTSVLWLGRSGGGKSTAMRWIGLCNARLGRRVVHFQAEGTEQEVLDAYDAGWTSISLHDIEYGAIPEGKKEKITKTQRDIMANGGEIYVYAAESFDSMSINDCRDTLLDIESLHGKIDLVIFDYLELFTVKGQYTNSEAGERKRREDVANKITNIAVEFKCGTVTAIQANDVTADKYNNENFVMTRSQISEYKGAIKPFSYFLTLNQTDSESEVDMLRIWVDKFRKYKKPLTPIRIYQSRANSRFYDAYRSIVELYNNH